MQWGAGRNCNTHGKKGRRQRKSCTIQYIKKMELSSLVQNQACTLKHGLEEHPRKSQSRSCSAKLCSRQQAHSSSDEPDWGPCTAGAYMWVPWNKTTKHHSSQSCCPKMTLLAFFLLSLKLSPVVFVRQILVVKWKTDSSTHWQVLCKFFLSSHTSLSINLISDLQMSLQCFSSPEHTINTTPALWGPFTSSRLECEKLIYI